MQVSGKVAAVSHAMGASSTLSLATGDPCLQLFKTGWMEDSVATPLSHHAGGKHSRERCAWAVAETDSAPTCLALSAFASTTISNSEAAPCYVPKLPSPSGRGAEGEGPGGGRVGGAERLGWSNLSGMGSSRNTVLPICQGIRRRRRLLHGPDPICEVLGRDPLGH